jgi:acetyl esterase/lipase
LTEESRVPIHPAIADRLHLLDGIPSFEAGFTNPEWRPRMDAFFLPQSPPAYPEVDVRDDALEGPHGTVPVRVYTPREASTASSRPGMVWMHGGGFRAGDINMPEADGVARHICAAAQSTVVSVGYRLAVGGVHYPVPLDDVVAAIAWVRDRAAELSVDPDRIAVGGASAGANLAAGATLRLRDEQHWSPALLVFAYGVAHATIPPASAALAEELRALPRILRFLPEDVDGTTRNYLGAAPSSAGGYAMPIKADLDGLPPTLVLNAEFDDLRPSGQTFAAALAMAGVDVQQVLVRGHLHGFLNYGFEYDDIVGVLRLMAGRVATASTCS